MKYRIGILKEHGLGLKEIQETIAKIDPIPGAKEFLDKLRAMTQVIIISDTFSQFAGAYEKNSDTRQFSATRLKLPITEKSQA